VGYVVHSGASGYETSMHYFSCFCRLGADSIKRASIHITPKLYFCIRWDLRVTYCISGCQTLMHYFSCLGGPDAVSIKSTMGHIALKLFFFHLVGSVGHIVKSGV
jgi:hypothetical protein